MKNAEEEDVMVFAIGLASATAIPVAAGGDAGSASAAWVSGGLRPATRRTERPMRAAEDRGGDRGRLLRTELGEQLGVRRSSGSPTSCIVSTRSHSCRRIVDGKTPQTRGEAEEPRSCRPGAEDVRGKK